MRSEESDTGLAKIYASSSIITDNEYSSFQIHVQLEITCLLDEMYRIATYFSLLQINARTRRTKRRLQGSENRWLVLRAIRYQNCQVESKPRIMIWMQPFDGLLTWS
jgi:hypothetical protein